MDDRSRTDEQAAEQAAEEAEEPTRPHAVEAETDWQRRKRLAAVFGDVLPATTSDERGGDTSAETGGTSDEWYRAQRPPHHGG